MPDVTLQQLREMMAKVLTERGFDPAALDLGSSHHYTCTCKTCWYWWKSVGLGDEQDPPFNQLQIDRATYEGAMVYSAEPTIAEINELVLQRARRARGEQ